MAASAPDIPEQPGQVDAGTTERLLALLPVPAWIFEVGSGLRVWNHAARVTFGAAAPRIASPAQLEFIAPDEREAVRRTLEALAHGGQPPSDPVEFRCANGGLRSPWFRMHATAIPGSAPPRALAVLLDITGERDAEAAWRESVRAHQSWMGIVPGMAYRCRKDADWMLEYASDGCQDLTGYSAAELVGNPDLALGRLIHPEDLDAVAAQCDRALARRTRFRGEYRIRTRDGSVKWVWDQCVGVFDDAGNARVIEGFMTDITEHKKLEAELYQSRKMESIGRLAGGIAHDFNNLLTAILGYTELARSAKAGESDYCQHLDFVTQAANRANALTQQLLAFARRQIVEPTSIRVDELLLRLSPLLRRLVTENIEFVVLAPGKAGSIRADRSQIEQVLVNLVANARDAMPKGGKLTIEADSVELDASTAPDGCAPGSYVRIRVRDTGGGIRPETRPYVFEPFFTTKLHGKGSGLGLATCFGIVKQHQGHIEFHSEEGVGTTFEVLLPRVEDADGDAEQKPVAASGGGRETVLVVEDESLVRDMAVEALRARGYTVLAASNGAHALQLVQQHFGPIDLLITDLVMPQLGGSELAEQLEKARPGMRVLYTSGYTETFEVPKSLRAIGGTFLRKPYTPALLASKVREVLD